MKINKRLSNEQGNEILTSICDEDGRVLGVCDGPKENGLCPWPSADGTMPCTGARLTAMGWTFKVADDAKRACPLAVLGIAGPRGGYSGRFGA